MGATDWSALDERLVPLAGRRDEVHALVRALRARQSRLVAGPAGIGKTRLLAEAVSRYSEPYLVLRRPRTPHDLLVQLGGMLECRIARFPSLGRATSVALKAAVLASLAAEPRVILLEDIADCDPRMYRFLQAVYHSPGNTLIVTTRSRDSLGYLRRLLWDPREEIGLQPLKRAEAAELFAAGVAAYQLNSLDLGDFRRQALRSARGNPGQILAMCRMAARPEYRDGGRIKFLPLRMDVLPAFVG